MNNAAKAKLVEGAIGLLMTAGLGLWIFILILLASSGLPMLRQLLGCMFATMIIFGILSLGVKSLKKYRDSLEPGSV